MKKQLILFIYLMAASLSFAGSTSHGDELKKISTSKQRHQQVFTLPDGLTLIIEEDHTTPTVVVQAWCATGSIDEGKHLGAGMSHVLEHMLFKGTTTRAPGLIEEQIRNLGGQANAYTSFDRTVFYIDAPSTGASQAIDILSDMMMNGTLPQYQKEKKVILQEVAMDGDDPQRMGDQLLLQKMFSVSPLGIPVIGYLDIYNQLKRDEVFDYYKKRYVPNNLCFVVVGDVDAQQVTQQFLTFFANYPRQALAPVLVPQEPPQMAKRVGEATFPADATYINIGWSTPGLISPDAPALDILSTVFNLRASSSMMGISFLPLDSKQGLLEVEAMTSFQNSRAAEAQIVRQVESLKKNKITADELEAAKNQMVATQLNLLETLDGRAADDGQSWLITGDVHFTQAYLDAIKKVTSDDLQRVAAKYLTKNNLTVTSLDPAPAVTPSSTPDQTSTNNPTTNGISVTPSNNVVEFTLPNGLRLLVHENHNLPLVSMVSSFRAGLLGEDDTSNGLTQLLANTITRGTRTKTAAQITHAIEQVGGSIDASVGTDSLNVCVDVMKPNLELGLNLLGDVLTNPTFPKDQINQAREHQLAEIFTKNSDPMTVARRSLKSELFGTHPYGMPLSGSIVSVSGLTPKMLQDFYKKYIVANNGVIAVFGDVDAEEIHSMALKAFGNLPSGKLAFTSPPIPMPLTTALDNTNTCQSDQTIIMKGFLGASISSPDRPALEILSTACSGLGSRFFNEMRNEMAMAYFVGAWNFNGLAPGAFSFYLGTDPSKADIAQAAFDDEIAQLAAGGLTQEELDAAKKILLENEAVNNETNDGFALEAASNELMGLGYNHYKFRADEINNVTLDQINSVIQKYLSVPGSAEIAAGPVAIQ